MAIVFLTAGLPAPDASVALPTLEEIRRTVQDATKDVKSVSYDFTIELMFPRGTLTGQYVGFDPARHPRAGEPIPPEDATVISHGRSVWRGTDWRYEHHGVMGFDQPESCFIEVVSGACVIEYLTIKETSSRVKVMGHQSQPDSPSGDDLVSIINGSCLRGGFEVERWEHFQGRDVVVLSRSSTDTAAGASDAFREEIHLDPARNYVPLRRINLRGSVAVSETEYIHPGDRGTGRGPLKIITNTRDNDGNLAQRVTRTCSNIKVNQEIPHTEFTVEVPAGTWVVNSLASYQAAFNHTGDHFKSLGGLATSWKTAGVEILDPATIAARRAPDDWQDQPVPGAWFHFPRAGAAVRGVLGVVALLALGAGIPFIIKRRLTRA